MWESFITIKFNYNYLNILLYVISYPIKLLCLSWNSIVLKRERKKECKSFWILSGSCYCVSLWSLIMPKERVNVAKRENHRALFSTSRAIAGNALYASNISVKKNIPLHGDESRQPFTWLGCCCGWRIKLTSWRCSQRENDLRQL